MLNEYVHEMLVEVGLGFACFSVIFNMAYLLFATSTLEMKTHVPQMIIKSNPIGETFQRQEAIEYAHVSFLMLCVCILLINVTFIVSI